MKVPMEEAVRRLGAERGLGLAIARARSVQEVSLQDFPHLTVGLVVLTEEDAELLASTAEKVLGVGLKGSSRG